MVSAKWTLRKQAALVLDNLAVTFSAALVLPHALSAIQIKLQAGGIGAEVSDGHPDRQTSFASLISSDLILLSSPQIKTCLYTTYSIPLPS